ncbi:MAG: ABC transporter permease [Lachnospiraceae bacterium]
MRLYKEELYKLIHKSYFIIGVIISVCILLLFLWFVEVGEERSTVSDNLCKGYEAVQQDRKITKEVEGVLTDEKIALIVEKYGFPQVVEEDYPGFQDSNYLNDFIMCYLSDGYLRDWNDYKIATKVYQMAQTDIGKIKEITGQDAALYYTKGWNVFFEVFQMGMVLGSILVILGVSVVFSDESQTGMLQIIFTTEEGKRKDIRAKIFASFTLTIGVYLAIVIVSLLLCNMVYGLDGANVPIGLIEEKLFLSNAVTFIPTIKYAMYTVMLALMALLVLCAITLWVSAHFANSFHSVVMSLVCWGLPVLIRIFIGGFAYLFISGTPIFLIMREIVWDISSIWFIPVSIAFAVFVVCIVMGHRTYRKFQVQ